jgi:hypothetical protein
MRRARPVLILLGVLVFFATPGRGQPSAAPSCRDWQQCQRLALEAADRGEYERFHDLAWRAVQTGPRNDPALMYLLARAQSLSGRPHDALIMLGRLADIGAVPADAVVSDEFNRVRQLQGWPELEARLARLLEPSDHSMLPPKQPAATGVTRSGGRARSTAAVEPGPRPVATPGAEPVEAVAAAKPTNAAAAATLPPPAEASRFHADAFSVAGVAYDSVSQRFLFGDRLGRKLRVVGDRSDHSVDLARAESGGFKEIGAIAIDARRGDLWVASADREGGGLLHKLQLISGRPLKTYALAGDGAAVAPIDLAISPTGMVLLLDAGTGRLLTLPPGHAVVQVAARIAADDLSSVTVADDEEAAYVAHDSRIERINLRTGMVSPLSLPQNTALGRIDAVRSYRRAIVAIDRRDGARRILKLELADRGTAVSGTRIVADGLSASGRISAAVAGDDLVYVVDPEDAAANPSPDVVVYRVTLR